MTATGARLNSSLPPDQLDTRYSESGLQQDADRSHPRPYLPHSTLGLDRIIYRHHAPAQRGINYPALQESLGCSSDKRNGFAITAHFERNYLPYIHRPNSSRSLVPHFQIIKLSVFPRNVTPSTASPAQRRATDFGCPDSRHPPSRRPHTSEPAPSPGCCPGGHRRVPHRSRRSQTRGQQERHCTDRYDEEANRRGDRLCSGFLRPHRRLHHGRVPSR